MIELAQKYYSKTFKEEETTSQNQQVAIFKQNLAEKLAELPSKPFRFQIGDLHRSFCRLKTKTSTGHEKVSNKLLKSIPASHYCFLLETFNQLLTHNTFPQHWKLSKMILLPKKNSTILAVDQTRPISLLPCLSKVFECCFLTYLLQWMNDNAILPEEQSGFRQHHSTTTRFIQFLQNLTTGLIQHTASLVIYVDFSKAFDQLWHDALLYKLHRMNCPYELIIFIMDYLKDRKCYIELNQMKSIIFDIEKGVPQGSCLGPILFLLFHCEMPQKIPSSTYSHLFADDLALILHASPWWQKSQFQSQMQDVGQKVLEQLHAYASEWKQPINFSKTEWQWIHRRVSIPPLSLTLDGHSINRARTFKYLGFHVDEHLTFTKHCKLILQRIQKNSAILKFVSRSQTSSQRARNLLAQAYIHPYFQLIYTIWPMLAISSINKIEAKNCQIFRLVHNWTDATNDEVKWLPNYQTAESKAQRFLRRFLDKAIIISPVLFEDYILCKAMPLYLRMHLEDKPYIDALPRGRYNHYVSQWLNPNTELNRKCFLDRLSILLTKG